MTGIGRRLALATLACFILGVTAALRPLHTANQLASRDPSEVEIDGLKFTGLERLGYGNAATVYTARAGKANGGDGGMAALKQCGWDEVGLCKGEAESMRSIALNNEFKPYMPKLLASTVAKPWTRQFWIAMELGDLDIRYWSLGEREALTDVETFKVILDVWTAVAALHKTGWAHRDLTANNVVFRTRDVHQGVWIIDFAFATDDQRAGPVSGREINAAYAAPVKKLNTWGRLVRKQDPKAGDVWALGVASFYFFRPELTRPPGGFAEPDFEERKKKLLGLMRYKGRDHESFPREEDARKSTDFSDVLARVFEPDPDQRITSADVVKRLKKILES